MKKLLLPFLFLAAFLISGCSSDGNDNEPEAKNEYNIEIADLYGIWTVGESTQDNLKDIKLVLDPKQSCTWSDQWGDYVGPYFFLENVNDDLLRIIGSKVAVESLDRIHLNPVKVSCRTDQRDASLSLTCDLYPDLPNQYWTDFNEKVDSSVWHFWNFNTFNYDFNITKFSERRLELVLRSSSVRYDSYSEKYPLRIQNGTKLVLIRQ